MQYAWLEQAPFPWNACELFGYVGKNAKTRTIIIKQLLHNINYFMLYQDKPFTYPNCHTC